MPFIIFEHRTVHFMSYEHDNKENVEKEPIAITGIGCRAPGGIVDTKMFWQILRDGIDTIIEIPDDRWEISTYYDPDPSAPGKMITRWGGFLEGIDLFDAGFFGISPREATWMDPQQRLMLEVAWEAFEDAGYSKRCLAGSRTGVFTGVSTQDYSYLDILNDPSLIDAYFATGSASSVIAGRVSYHLDLHGPSLSLDTACSSSLAAVHLACRNLRDGCCDIALAGGINLILVPRFTLAFSKFGMMAADGRCKTFDARADGYVRGEGCGLVVLKRLSDAQADGDSVYALIRGSAINQDGHGSGLTVPSPDAQRAVLLEALADAGLEAQQVTYIEAHGTGTPVGDPVEMEALKAVYGAPRKDGCRCLVGSVKTNIGHLEAASGILGLIKAVLCLQYEAIPQNLHFERLHPNISLFGSAFIIPTELTAWPASPEHRFAGVSSFGFSGTNTHIVIEEAPATDIPIQKEDDCLTESAYLLPLSAHSKAALTAVVANMQAYLTSGVEDSAYDICYTASIRRTHFHYRTSVAAESVEHLVKQLQVLMDDTSEAGLVSGRGCSVPRNGLVFVYTGQGSQWAGMGNQLYDLEPVFHTKIEECETILSRYTSWSLVSELRSDEGVSRLAETEILQPVLCALQIALTTLWQSWGITPAAVVGHSIGEVAAAHIAGIFDLESALYLAFHRGRLMQATAGLGTMAAVGLTEKETLSLLEAFDNQLSIAAVNSPTSVVVSGDKSAIDILGVHLAQEEIFFRKLDINYGFHSPLMDPFQHELKSIIKDVPRASPSLTIVSSVTGQVCSSNELDANYWGRQLRQPVQFADAIDTLIALGFRDFLEIGPHPALNRPIYDCLKKNNVSGEVFASLRRYKNERLSVLNTLGYLYRLGFAIDWEGVYAKRGRVVHLPVYPWQRDSYWIGDKQNNNSSFLIPRPHTISPHALKGLSFAPATYPDTSFWETSLSLETDPYLQDFEIDGTVVLPAAVFMIMALEAARQAMGENTVSLHEIQFRRPLVFSAGGRKRIQVAIQDLKTSSATFQILSINDQTQAREWIQHTTGTILARNQYPPSVPPILETIRSRCTDEYTRDRFYTNLKDYGLNYGPSYLCIDYIRRRDGEAIGCITGQKIKRTNILDHATLDACFQVLVAAIPGEFISRKRIYLPVALQRFVLYHHPEGSLWGHARITDAIQNDKNQMTFDLTLFDDSGGIVLEVSDGTLQQFENRQQTAVLPEHEKQENDILRRCNIFHNKVLALDPGMPRKQFIEKYLQDEIVQIMQLTSGRIDRKKPLDTLGFDSLMALELRNRIEMKLSIILPETLIWSRKTSLAKLTEYLAKQLNLPLEPEDRLSVQNRPDERAE